MKVLIADDQPDVRNALKVLLEQEDGVFAFEEAEGIESLLLCMKNKHPELVLLDWELSSHDMADTIPVLKRLVPGARVIALSGKPEAEKAAIKAGADAFVSKGENPEKLLDAIYKVMA